MKSYPTCNKYDSPLCGNTLEPKRKKPNRLRLGSMLEKFWLPDLDSNQGPAD